MVLKVIAECVDVRTGRRFLPGETFEPAPDAEQQARLINAGCLELQADAPGDELVLDRLRRDELEELAAARGIDIDGLRTKADIIAAIEAAAG